MESVQHPRLGIFTNQELAHYRGLSAEQLRNQLPLNADAALILSILLLSQYPDATTFVNHIISQVGTPEQLIMQYRQESITSNKAGSNVITLDSSEQQDKVA